MCMTFHISEVTVHSFIGSSFKEREFLWLQPGHQIGISKWIFTCVLYQLTDFMLYSFKWFHHKPSLITIRTSTSTNVLHQMEDLWLKSRTPICAYSSWATFEPGPCTEKTTRVEFVIPLACLEQRQGGLTTKTPASCTSLRWTINHIISSWEDFSMKNVL